MTDDINIRLQQLENEVKELKLKSKKILKFLPLVY